MSLRLRINLVLTLVIAAFTAAMVFVIVNDLRSSVREEIESTTRVAVQLVETMVAGVYLEPGPAERSDALLFSLARVGHVRANDIRFYDEAGRLLYESPRSTYRAGSRAPQWFTRLMHPEVPPARLSLPRGAIVVTPDATPSIVEAWDQLKSFALIALAFLIIVNLVVFSLLARALRPLPEILGGLAELSRNRFDVRLPAYRTREFASLSEGFNRLAESLAGSLAQERELAQNRRLTALIQSQLEDERRALARELHDELSQYVTAIKTIGTAIAARAGAARADIRDNADTIVSVASHIYDIVHRIVRRLRPSGLDDLGLAETLRDAVSGWARRHAEMRFELALSGDLDHLGDGLSIAVYRVVQEALSNAVRHAEASAVHVSVARQPAGRFGDAVVISVRDDGKGLDAAAGNGRYGIAGMRERAQGLGGSFAISGPAGQGVTVSAVLPVVRAGQAAPLAT
jgi:two-component system sensor histidine kinase UhpB